jgi:hypothetical protein
VKRRIARPRDKKQSEADAAAEARASIAEMERTGTFDQSVARGRQHQEKTATVTAPSSLVPTPLVAPADEGFGLQCKD